VSRKKASRVRAHDDEESGDGLMARLIDRTFENPAMSGGLLVMALTATAIISNATLLQGTRHPEPLFTTRPAETAAAPAVASAPVGPQTPEWVIGSAPMPHPSPMRGVSSAVPLTVPAPTSDISAMLAEEPTPPAPIPEPRVSEAALLTEIQRELARVGLYLGAIDGVLGPRTTAAIEAFEAAAGIVVTGRPSPELLTALGQPMPPRDTRAIATRNTGGDIEAAALSRREHERAALIAAEEQRAADGRLRENVRTIQLALNRIGYGPLAVEGADDSETRDAIRRFELDMGMPVTGAASDAVIARLIAIGAIKPG